MNKMINKKVIFSTAIVVATVFNLAGCGLSGISASDVKDPSSPISSRETPVTKELGCFGDMLTTYRRMATSGETIAKSAKLIPVAVVSVTDKTGVYNTYGSSEIPTDMTDMAIGSVAKIGGALRLIHIPKGEEYIMSGVANGGNGKVLFGNFSTRHYNAPTVLMYGNLTEYDRTLKNHKTGIDGSLDYLSTKTRQGVLKQGTAEQQVFEDRNDDSGGISGSYGNIENVSRMTMDFRVVKLNDAGLISNESVVTNTIILYQRAEDKSFGVSLNGKSLGTLSTFGLSGAAGYANTMTDVDARHAALRMLIERSVMESLGKTYNVPYWRCLAKEEITKEDSPKKADNEKYEPKFVVRPNDTVRLSEKASKMLTSSNNDYQYPDSMIDKDSLVDLNVINAVKRFFERTEYLDKKSNLIAFSERPAKMTNLNYLAYNDRRAGDIKELIDSENKKKPNKAPQTVIDAAQQQKDNIHKIWLSELRARLPSKISECDQYYFISNLNYPSSSIPEDIANMSKEKAEEFNPYLYQTVDTKMCLLNKVVSAYAANNKDLNDAKALHGKYKIYGTLTGDYSINNPDFFATLWLNIPIELNARWNY